MKQKVIPTSLWRTSLTIFGVGELPTPDPNGVEVDSKLAEWAISNQFASLLQTSQKEVSTTPSDLPKVADLKVDQTVIDFLNQIEVEQFKEIQGISENKANQIINKRPITRDSIGKVLTPTQIESVQKFLAH